MSSEAQSILVRLVMHPTNNPHLIDKLIILKGLPYEWVFKKAKYRIDNADGTVEEGVGDQLLTPWEPDADVNIPREVRDLTEPITYLRWFPDVRHQDKTFHGFWDKRTVWGFKIDYGFGPAQELWVRIENYIDSTLPRGDKMPQPVQAAKDQKSEFRTFLARRGKSLSSLEMVEMSVPVVDLRVKTSELVVPVPEVIKTVVTVPVDPAPPVPEEKKDDNLYKCASCNKEFNKVRALRMHMIGAHRKEKVKV